METARRLTLVSIYLHRISSFTFNSTYNDFSLRLKNPKVLCIAPYTEVPSNLQGYKLPDYANFFFHKAWFT